MKQGRRERSQTIRASHTSIPSWDEGKKCMSPNKTLVGNAVLRGDTSDQIELVLWLIVVGSMDE